LFVFPEESAKELIDVLMGQPVGTTKIIDECGQSALLEMSNIFVGAYLSSLANLLGLKILPEPPHTATDMVQALIDFVLIKLSRHSNDVLIVKEIIQVDGHNINGIFLIVFDNESLKKTLSALHEKYGVL
jgi:chemotaxis protein CheC